jgi:hypothetical protein
MREAVVILLLLRLSVLEKDLVTAVEEPMELGGDGEVGWIDPEIAGVTIGTGRLFLLGVFLTEVADDHSDEPGVKVVVTA